MVRCGTPGRGRAQRRQLGFSIVELVIVASIIGVAAAIAVPRYSASVARYRLDAAARRIVADLDRARTAARVSSAARRVAFKPAEVAYTVTVERSLRSPAAPYEVLLADEPYRVHAMTASFAGLTEVSFDAYGLPDRAGEITVRIGAEQRTIRLNGATGKADIQ